MATNRSNGYDEIATTFMSIRAASRIGATTICEWSRALPAGGAVLDLGCGHGVPVAEVLIGSGFDLHGIDASSRMIDAFRDRFPEAPTACETVEESAFLGRKFDGVVACGLIFLLASQVQRTLIRKVAKALDQGGHFLFTAPEERGVWADTLTGRESTSLGDEAYRRLLDSVGLAVDGHLWDEGRNHYYATSREARLMRSNA